MEAARKPDVGTRAGATVERRSSASLSYADFLREYVAAGKPVVVENAIDAWPARHKWTPDYFATRFADKLVQVSYKECLGFAEFIRRAKASTEQRPGPYMYRLFLHEHLPEVLPDVHPQCVYSFPRRYASPLMPEYWRRPDGHQKLLIGGVGGKFPVLHFDGENVHATITQVYGDKEFILFPPSDTPYLYPSPLQRNHSLIDNPTNCDARAFPEFQKATLHRTVLGPGDMVFVPCGWWHTARALNMSISVGMNILDSSNWAGFVDEVVQADAPVKRLAKRVYLTGLGLGLGAMEGLQARAPGLARAMRFPIRLAPATSHVAPDPALSPLHIRQTTA